MAAAVKKPQSKIVNNNEDYTAGLKIIIQKDINNTWQDIETVVDKKVTIPAGSLVKLDTGEDNLGNQVLEGFNNLGVTINEIGDYRVYAVLKKNGVTLKDLDGKLLEANWEFSVS